jgi:hypothetical protein
MGKGQKPTPERKDSREQRKKAIILEDEIKKLKRQRTQCKNLNEAKKIDKLIVIKEEELRKLKG